MGPCILITRFKRMRRPAIFITVAIILAAFGTLFSFWNASSYYRRSFVYGSSSFQQISNIGSFSSRPSSRTTGSSWWSIFDPSQENMYPRIVLPSNDGKESRTFFFDAQRAAVMNSQTLVDQENTKTRSPSILQLKQWEFTPTTQTPFFLTAIAVMRNKAEYVAEWIEFHLLQGFDRFVIYDHMSTDNLHEVLEPYVRVGIVELIVWPLDYSTVTSGPMGPRRWVNAYHLAHFERVFYHECLHVNDSWHLHGGCQRSAVMDGIARYRGRTVWLASMDVDEFFFIPLKNGELPARLEDIMTVRERLIEVASKYDQIRVPGEVFGTDGFMDTPPGKDGLPSRMVTERHRYVRLRTMDRDGDVFATQDTYCEKSFVKGNLPTGTLIHHFTFDKDWLGFSPYTVEQDYSIIAMNHYKYLSHAGKNRKARANTNWALDYWRPSDVLLAEMPYYNAGFLVPIVRNNMLVRMQEYKRPPVFTHSSSMIDDLTADARRKERRKNGKSHIDMCIAFTHLEGEPHHLRRSVHSIMQYLKLTEPDITYKTVLVTLDRRAPEDDSTSELEYLSDLVPFLDRIEVMPPLTPWARVVDRATDLCGQAPYILFMEDMWEARFQEQTIADRMRPGLDIPLLKPAMQLMEMRDDVHEVWVGDTPAGVPEYAAARGPWYSVDFLPPMDRTASNIKWLDRRAEEEVRDAIWLKSLVDYSAENSIMAEHGKQILKLAVEAYKNKQSQKSDNGWFGRLWTSHEMQDEVQLRRVKMAIQEEELLKQFELKMKAKEKQKGQNEASGDVGKNDTVGDVPVMTPETARANNTASRNSTKTAADARNTGFSELTSVMLPSTLTRNVDLKITTTARVSARATDAASGVVGVDKPEAVKADSELNKAKSLERRDNGSDAVDEAASGETIPVPGGRWLSVSDMNELLKQKPAILDNEQYSKIVDNLEDVYKHRKWTLWRLGCDGEQCPQRRPYVRLMSATEKSGLGAFRLGGTLKHRERFRGLGRLEDVAERVGARRADSNGLRFGEAVQDAIGRIAAGQGYHAAQFCMMDPGLDDNCSLDPDHMSDDATTGIMWRQRPVTPNVRGGWWMSDRRAWPYGVAWP